MFTKSLLILSSAFVATFALAQPASVGTVTNVTGSVTDTTGSSVTSTSVGENVVDGERFVTSSTGTLQLTFNNGCVLTLQPNQAVTIDGAKNCKDLIVINTLTNATAVAGVGFGTGALAVGGLVLLTAFADREIRKDNEGNKNYGNNNNNNGNNGLSGR